MLKNKIVWRFEGALSIEKEGLTTSLHEKRNYFPNIRIPIPIYLTRPIDLGSPATLAYSHILSLHSVGGLTINYFRHYVLVIADAFANTLPIL